MWFSFAPLKHGCGGFLTHNYNPHTIHIQRQPTHCGCVQICDAIAYRDLALNSVVGSPLDPTTHPVCNCHHTLPTLDSEFSQQQYIDFYFKAQEFPRAQVSSPVSFDVPLIIDFLEKTVSASFVPNNNPIT
nr:unnamed protein product [Haemonchus contortus]